jgi:hypothetical protein
VLRRATVNPHRARRHHGGVRAAIAVAEALRAVLGGVLDFLTPGPPAAKSPTGRTSDPYVAELARQARAKYAVAPHLLVAVRVTAAGPTTAAARAAAQDIGSGYTLLSAHWRNRRLRRPVTAATWRWAAPSEMVLASVVEVAALAGLPAEPAAHGLPGAASRRLPATRDVFTGPAVSRSRPVRRVPAGRRGSPKPPLADDGRGDNDPPTIWRAP